jgi:hypothetical protein
VKFGDKYELLESLTTGRVETFVANDKVRAERVLVHILQCDPQKPNQPTVQWVLEAFRSVAPEPVGLVLETGRYSGTLYAYLVTKLPDEAALSDWVRRYKAQARDTQEFPAPVAKPIPESEAPTEERTPAEESRAASPITQLFRDFDLQAKSGAPSAAPKPPEQPSPPLPKITATADPSGVRPTPPRNPEIPRISFPSKTETNLNPIPDSFPPDFTAKVFPSEPIPPATKNSPKPGEFTSFFQGPFRGDRPSETPASGIAGNEPAGTGFTGFFNPDSLSRTSSTNAPPSTGLPRAAVPAPVLPEPPREPSFPPQPAAYVRPTPPIFPTPVPLNPMPPPRAPSALSSDGATRAFARPNIEPAPGPPAPPSGPSAYTQVISVKAMKAEGDVVEKPTASDSAALPAIPLPTMPPPPAMPKIALPALPSPPKPPKVAIPEPPVSYWPLILTLTVLFFIAVLLVLYFVLKH